MIQRINFTMQRRGGAVRRLLFSLQNRTELFRDAHNHLERGFTMSEAIAVTTTDDASFAETQGAGLLFVADGMWYVVHYVDGKRVGYYGSVERISRHSVKATHERGVQSRHFPCPEDETPSNARKWLATKAWYSV